MCVARALWDSLACQSLFGQLCFSVGVMVWYTLCYVLTGRDKCMVSGGANQ